MELTVNTFTKGLLKDTNPMIQGTDTLTDALNATIVTMNGNEIILLNDMGNRRVDHAYLPEGYEPVGMKEYGGVIYVASLNPKTKMCQIGSFPSPLKRHQNKSYDDNNFLISFSDCLSDTTDEYIDENKIVLLFPLMNENSIHVGDKFVIVDEGIWNDKENIENTEDNEYIHDKITNFDNIFKTKVLTPKNKLYTLAIGVLDNTGQFYDITNNLVRYDKYGKIISFNENTSDIIKFNTGYFIAPSISDDNKIQETINDSSLIEDRLAIPANTYSEKFIGPLYLKKTYNCIRNFNYDFLAIRNGDDIKITITGICTYNCPDGVQDTRGDGDETYETYSTGTTDFEFFDVTFYKSEENEEIGNTLTTKPTKRTITYDKVSNLYTATVIKEYSIPYDDTLTKLTYDVKVRANSECSNYIKSLSYLNQTFNTSLLNTTQLIIDGWRFRRLQDDDGNYLNQTELVYNLLKYQTRNVEFKNFTLYFKDVTSSNNDVKILSGLPINSGINNVILDWDEIGLVERKLYEIRITYNILDLNTGKYLTQDLVSTNSNMFEADTVAKSDIFNNEAAQLEVNPSSVQSDSDGSGVGESNGTPNIIIKPKTVTTNNFEIEDLWILTTALFNDCFDSVRNYCVVEEEDDIKVLSEEKIKEKLQIKYKINYIVEKCVDKGEELTYEGSLISFVNEDISYICRHRKNIVITGRCEIEYPNEELYPDYILILFSKNLINSLDDNLKYINNTEIVNTFIDLILGNHEIENLINVCDNLDSLKISYPFEDNLDTEDDLDLYYDVINFKINGYFNYCEYYLGESKPVLLKIDKEIVPVESIFDSRIIPTGDDNFNLFASPLIYSLYWINNNNNIYVSLNTHNSGTDPSNSPFGGHEWILNKPYWDGLKIFRDMSFNNNKLFTYLLPVIYDNMQGVTDIRFLQSDDSVFSGEEEVVHINTNQIYTRLFIKAYEDSKYTWKLVTYTENDNVEYYFDADGLSVKLKNLFSKYNDKNVYVSIPTKVETEINAYTLDTLKMKYTNLEYDFKLNIPIDDVNITYIKPFNIKNSFNNSVNYIYLSEDKLLNTDIKINNPQFNDEILSKIYSNGKYLGIVVTDQIDEDNIKGSISDAYGREYSLTNKFYYCDNGKLYPLNCSFDISFDDSSLRYTSDKIIKNKYVLDYYIIDPPFNNIDNAYVKYDEIINLDKDTFYYE